VRRLRPEILPRGVRLLGEPRFLSLLQQAVVLCLGLVSSISLARALGPSERGEYAIAQVIYIVAAPAFSVGVPLTVMKPAVLVPRARAMVAHLAVSTILASISVGLIGPIDIAPLLMVVVVGPVLTPWSEAFLARTGRASSLQYIRTIDVASSSFIILLLFITQDLTLSSAVLAIFGPTIIIRSGIVLRYFRLLEPQVEAGSKMLPYYWLAAKRFWFRELLSAFALYIDIIAAAFVLRPTELGIYAVASALGKMASAPFSALYGEVVRRSAGGTEPSLVLKSILPIPACIVVSAVIGITVFGPTFIPILFGLQFNTVAGIAPWTLIAFSFAGATSMLETVITISRPRRASAGARVLGILLGVVSGGIVFELSTDAIAGIVAGLLTMNIAVLAVTVLSLAGLPARMRPNLS
jgi:O-antigen/teichoic acid export membrane protein